MKDDPKQSIWKIHVFDGSENESTEDNYYVTLSDAKQSTPNKSMDEESKSDHSTTRSVGAAKRR